MSDDATVVTEPGEPEGTTGLQIAETENATGHPVVVLSNTHDIEGVETGRDVFVRRDELDEVLAALLDLRRRWKGRGYVEDCLTEYRDLERGDGRPSLDVREAALLKHFVGFADGEADG